MLHFIQLANQLGNQLINSGIHVFMLGARDQRAVRGVDGCIGNKIFGFFGKDNMRINQIGLPFF